MNTVKLNGSNYLRQRIILATLSGKSLKITKIRESESNPGVTEEEMNLLRLVESFTNGTTIKVNETGTVLFYSPGMLTGGTVTHKCHKARAVSYFGGPISIGSILFKPFTSNINRLHHKLIQ